MSKGLYLDLNLRYHNPSRGLIVHLLMNVFDQLDIYGPGYVPEYLLEEGIDEYVKSYGPYDFMITNEMIFFAHSSGYYESESKKDFLNMYHIRFSPDLLNEKIITEMNDFFMKTSNRKLLIFLQLDFYNISNEHISLLNSLKNSYFFTFGKDVISKMDDLKNIKNEKFYSKCNDNWYKFVHNNVNRIASLVHFISDEECNFTPLEERKYIIYVPGVNYWFRKKVLQSLNKKYKMPSKIHLKIYSLLNKLHLKPFRYLFANDFYNYIFRNHIFMSKFVATCGSGLNWPLRKFFEIPAGGSVLICNPFYNQNHLGFIDKKTCFLIEDPSEINSSIETLNNNKKLAHEISKEGQRMIMKNHSVSARTRQMKEVIDVILDEKKLFEGSYWDSGKYIVKYQINKG